LLLSLSENVGNDSEYKKTLSQLERLEKTSSVDTADLQATSNIIEQLKNYLVRVGTSGVGSGYGFDIPIGALSIVAGRTGHGKTTLMLNMLVNMLENTEKDFYFFTFEESKEAISLKIIEVMANCEMKNNKPNAFADYIRDNMTGNKEINKAISLFRGWCDSGRLVVVSENSNDRQLCEKIHWIKENCDNVGGVFVDYIQVIKPSEKAFSRQLELQRITANLRETAKSTDYPIILGAQFGRADSKAATLRLGNIREAGDIEQEASLVLGLWNCFEGQAIDDKEKKTYTTNTNILEIHILKNRATLTDIRRFDCHFRRTRKIEAIQQEKTLKR